MGDAVNHPSHYNTGKIEVIDAIEDWKLDFHLGHVVKYVARAGHKASELEDLKKAAWYLARRITLIEKVGVLVLALLLPTLAVADPIPLAPRDAATVRRAHAVLVAAQHRWDKAVARIDDEYVTQRADFPCGVEFTDDFAAIVPRDGTPNEIGLCGPLEAYQHGLP